MHHSLTGSLVESLRNIYIYIYIYIKCSQYIYFSSDFLSRPNKPKPKKYPRWQNVLILPFRILLCSGPYLWNKILTRKTLICNLEYYPLFKNISKEVFYLNGAKMYF